MSAFQAKREQLRKFLAESGLFDLQRLQVANVMTPRPISISPDLTALDLVELFYEKRFRHLLVAENDRLVGVISDRDVRGCLGVGDGADPDKLLQIRAVDLMSTDLVTAPPGAPLQQAVALMVEQGINCLPVIAGDRLVGILTSTDLYLLLYELLQSARLTPAEQPAQSAC